MMKRRIMSAWLEHYAIERFMRNHHGDGPLVLYWRQKNADRIYALNHSARQAGLTLGMGLGDARSFCANLRIAPADIDADARDLNRLARELGKFSPWVATDGDDGILLDITGSAHLFGGEDHMSLQVKAALRQRGFHAHIAIAKTRAAAWAFSHFGNQDVRKLPVAALRIDHSQIMRLERLGLRHISDLTPLPRASLARRFGMGLLERLDAVLELRHEPIMPLAQPVFFATKMNFPEPIGLLADVMMGIERLLAPLCQKMRDHHIAARAIRLGLRRVDGRDEVIEIGFARPMRSEAQIFRLIGVHVEKIDAGFGFDQIRVHAHRIEAIDEEMMTGAHNQSLDDLFTRIGNRIGFENIRKPSGRDTHLPDQAIEFIRYDEPEMPVMPSSAHRPYVMFEPEWIWGHGMTPPLEFKWRRMRFRVASSQGPERISPQWWRQNLAWKSGVRDYWRVATLEGRRLWLFYTPQNPAWYVHGEFA